MATMEPVTKRLHISGLSPNIKESDLTARFASFGKVVALHGLGKLNGLSQPRPYAFLTLETTMAQLTRCMNLLNGTTWKGAKLRIGEAKPDFAERIRRENEEAATAARPAKRRRLARGCDAVHAKDMTLMSLAKIETRAAWRATPLGRLVRPMRMRPLRPLPPPPTPSTSIRKADGVKPKAKTKHRAPPACMRIVKIDPEKWGCTYMKGFLLEGTSNIILPESTSRGQMRPPTQATLEDDEDVAQTTTTTEVPIGEAESSLSKNVDESLAVLRSQPGGLSEEVSQGANDDLAAEASRSLALLKSMFSGKGCVRSDESDWGGAESMSDLGLIEDATDENFNESRSGEKQRPIVTEDDGEIEFVPRSDLMKKDRAELVQESAAITETKDAVANAVLAKPVREQKSAPVTVVQTLRLKDMFRPREEDAGFSILANLDLDLELDDSINIPPAPPAPLSVISARESSISAQKAALASTASFDINRAFFFAHSSLKSQGSYKIPQDVFSLLQAKLNPTDLETSTGKGKTALKTKEISKSTQAGKVMSTMNEGIKFYRTEDSDAVKARWEARRLELTRDWKRRHREAVKTARRRGGGRD